MDLHTPVGQNSARTALPWAAAGSQASTADAERELMELWSAVEKDKEAARERALAARRAQFARLRHQVHLARCSPSLPHLSENV